VTERSLRSAVLALSGLGASIAGYLVWAHYADVAISCTSGGCETVQRSSYAELVGVPVALLGLLTYVGIAATATVRSERARVATAALVLTGFLFSAYLLLVQLTVIHAVCDWCVASDAVMSALLVVVLLWLRHAQPSLRHSAGHNLNWQQEGARRDVRPGPRRPSA
jgi:uncharacterized membrane protein